MLIAALRSYRIFFIILILFELSVSVNAQTDSVTFTNAVVRSEKIAHGIVLKRYRFTDSSLFNSHQNISVLEIKQGRKAMMDLAYEVKEKKTTSTFGKENNAIAALNGTFFNVQDGGSVDFIRSDGKVINENVLNKKGERATHQKAGVTIRKGKLDIVKWDGTADWEKKLKADDVMLSGPLLVEEHHAAALDSALFNTARHPRTAVGRIDKRKILLLAVDGRHENAAGMSLFELSSVLRWMGCREAINLDGGGSTALWIYNAPENGVVNYPSDNKLWDHQGERKVANVLLLKRK